MILFLCVVGPLMYIVVAYMSIRMGRQMSESFTSKSRRVPVLLAVSLIALGAAGMIIAKPREDMGLKFASTFCITFGAAMAYRERERLIPENEKD